MRVVLYAMVSTPKSDKKETKGGDRERQDPETQLIKLRAFAKAREYEVVKVYVDRLSGKDANRPAIEAMMKAAFRHEFEAILFVRLNRIMRSIANFVAFNDELNAAMGGSGLCGPTHRHDDP
jgi:DNA invertase Pin-like site-specific DNA recombinase